MDSSDFLLTCIVAIITVFIILIALAIVIRLLTEVFQQKYSDDDPAIIAAIGSHFSRIYPQTNITKVEETK